MSKITGRKIELGELLYLISLGLYLVRSVLNSSFYSLYISASMSNLICMICVVILLTRELLYETYAWKTWVGWMLMALFCLVAIRVDTMAYVTMLLLIYCGRNLSFDRIAKFSVWVLLFCVLFVIGSAYLGWIPNYTRVEIERSNREYLGFLYALYASNFWLHISAVFIYVYRKKMPWMIYGGLAVVAYWLFVKTNSRMAFLMTILVILAGMVLKVFPRLLSYLKAFDFLMVLLAPLCVVGSFVLSIRFNETVSWMYRLNRALSNRLIYTQESIERYGVRAFGEEIQWVGHGLNANGIEDASNYLFVDNMFVNYWQHYGWICGCLITVMIVWASWRMFQQRAYERLAFFCIFLLFGVIDNSAMRLWYNIFLLVIVSELFGNAGKQREDREYEV